MAIERFYSEIYARPFISNGKNNGVITISDAYNFKVKMMVTVEADGFEPINLEIKRILNKNEIVLGDIGRPIHNRRDMSMYTLSISPTIKAAEQKRPEIPPIDYERAVYEEEPTVAKRQVLVDYLGNHYDRKNPVPVKMPSIEDSFGRIKVATTYLLFDASFQYSLQNKIFIKKEILGGAIIHNSTRAAATISCSGTTGSQARFRSRNYFPYSPAFTNTLIGSFNFHGITNNVTKRLGLYDDKNGFFLQLNENGWQFRIRSSISGSVLEEVAEQDKWNKDTLDGLGPSGKKLDPSKQQIVYLQYQWLGSGSVFFGFIIDGEIIIAHEFDHANLISSLYSQTGTLPILAEVINNGGIASFMEFTCCSLVSNGAISQHGHLHRASNGTQARSLPVINTSYPIIALRKAPGYSNIPVQILDMSAFSTSQDDFLVQIVHKPALVDAVWLPVSNSFCEYDVSATGWSGGEIVAEFYMKGNLQASEKLELLARFWDLTLGDDFDGNSEVMLMAATPLTNNANMYGIIAFKEFE